MNDKKTKTITDVLLKEGLLKPDQLKFLQEEARKYNQSVEEYIYQNKIISEENFVQAKAKLLKIPYIDLRNKKISPEVLQETSKEVASHYKFIPFSKVGTLLKVAMVDPEDMKACEALKFIALRHHLATKIYITSETSFASVLKQYRAINVEIKKALERIEKEIEIKGTPEEKISSKTEIKKIVEEAPVSKIIDIILKHAIEGKASDIHIEPTDKELRVRYRLDGVLHTTLILPKRLHPAAISRIKILSNLKIDEKRKPQDGRFRITFNGREIDFRVSTLPTANGEKTAIRILDTSTGLQKLANLGLKGENYKLVLENIKKPYGMILITGPTGSGKSTTLYSILNILNQEGVNIVTLEDPVEYYIHGINQSQVVPEIGYSFASGLRSILRQDPDIIMVGEIRDKETAELAVHAALTGHIMLSTLHTNDAVGVVPRLLDMGIEPFLITSSLNLVIAQRLMRRLCKYCRRQVDAPPGVEKMIISEFAKIPSQRKESFKLKHPLKIYQKKGCAACSQTGFKGRIAVFEILAMTKKLEEIILKESSESVIREEARRQGMITMTQDGILKALNGVTTIEEVLRVTKG